jgi:hypothetical protein
MTIFNPDRTYGVELEVHFRGTQQQLADAINTEFVARDVNATAYAAGYTHADNRENRWKIVSDASVIGGWEVVSPILFGASGFEQIKAVCEALNTVNCTIGRDTGMHVHHDMADLTPKQIGMTFGTYAAFQTLLNYAVSPSRRNAYFSRQVSTTVTRDGDDKWDDVRNNTEMFRKLRATVGDRYSSVNWDSFNPRSPQYHGTIEFRQHQGTTNATKVITWILITQSIIERSVQGKAKFMKSLRKERTTGKSHAKGDFYRFKNFIGVTNDHNEVPSGSTWTASRDSHLYKWAFKQLYKNLKKFSRDAGYGDVRDIA